MAIKIPSKNIYEIDNPKIRDNIIDNVSVEQTVITPNNEYEVSVYNQAIKNGFELYKETTSDILFGQVDITGYAKEFWYAYHWISPQYIKNISIEIPKITNNKWISKIYTGLKENEKTPYIGVTVRATKETGTATGTYPLSSKPITNYTKTEDYTVSIKPQKTYTYTHTISGNVASKSVTTPEKWVNEDNINTASYTDDNDYYYSLNLTILCGYEEIGIGGYTLYGNPYMQTPTSISLSGECEKYTAYQVEITIYGNTIGIDLTDGSVTYGSGNKPFLLSGNELMQYKETINYANVKRFSHKGAGLTINGNENNLLVVNGTCVVPSGIVGRYHIVLGVVSLPKGKYILKGMPKAIGMTALILHNTKVGTIAESFYEPIEFYLEDQQDLTFYFAVSDGNIFNNFIIAPEIININNLEYLANNILNQYANGKETATLLCDISDYYDESGEKVIDITTNKMSFRLHDEVIPYVYGADGKDKPMSKKQDGSAKVFEVVGSNIIYDGAVWQELTLLEKTQNN